MLNAFRHLTPSFIAYRGLKPGWKFWWKRDSRILFSSQNQIESLSRPGLLCPISLESIWFRVMRRSKCMMTPGVTHLSFWEQPLVMERHVLHYEYKWADLSFSRNNWICYIYIYIGMVIAWYCHIQQVCKALALKLDYPQWRIQGRGAPPTLILLPNWGPLSEVLDPPLALTRCPKHFRTSSPKLYVFSWWATELIDNLVTVKYFVVRFIRR